MKKMTDKIVVLVTCGRAPEAKRIARRLVQQRLAACVNVLDAKVHSTYRWKGKVETAAEHLLLIKSSGKLLPRIRREIERLHSYDVPEVIALPIADGSPAYLAWLADCLRAVAPRATSRKQR